MSFAGRLERALTDRGSLCAGIDPHTALLQQWGLPDTLDSLKRFADTCVQAFADTAAVVKPQSAFFERFGSAGVAVLAETIAGCRAGGAVVLLDVKRGDIGSTMAAYAQAYLNPASDLAADAITVSPYLGVGSLEPAFSTAAEFGAGVFVLCLTSNPEGPQVQHAIAADGRTVAQTVIDEVAARNTDAVPFGDIGVVVGATIGGSIADLGNLNGSFLVPGIGAQGGTAEHVRQIFAGGLSTVLPSVSRELLQHGPTVAQLHGATEKLIEDFRFLRS
jgi:orotidine-5'-phosphate decarboxylase